jgi:hypothetical protein
MITQRFSNWFELLFWKIAVFSLSIFRPLGSRLLANQKLPSIKRKILNSFASNLLIALSGWALGLIIGFLLTFWAS